MGRARGGSVRRLALLAVAALPLVACGQRILKPTLYPPTFAPSVDARSPQLKVHPKSGELVVLDSWRVDSARSVVEGTGLRLTIYREPKEASGSQSIPLDEVALLETNTPESIYPGGLSTLGVMTTIFGTLAVVCAADPKGCFGSCPTFYVEGAESGRPQAEGFSGSIARVLEARDVDALLMARPGGDRVAVTMRNEALETQAVRRLRLRASSAGWARARRDRRTLPSRPQADRGGRVPCTGGRLSRGPACPRRPRARVEGGRVGPRHSRGRGAEVPACRRPGRSPGRCAPDPPVDVPLLPDHGLRGAQGRGPPRCPRARRAGGRAEGDWDGASPRGHRGRGQRGRRPWTAIGSFGEAGPIAGDVRVLPFPAARRGPVRVRLRLAKGHWRLGAVALARLDPPVEATGVNPERALPPPP
jgi:hypothetical protein